MSQVIACKGEGGTILEVTFPTIGRKIIIFGKEMTHPKTGEKLKNPSWSMYFYISLIVAHWNFFAPYFSVARRRAGEWEQYQELVRLSIEETYGNKESFSEALALALKFAK